MHYVVAVAVAPRTKSQGGYLLVADGRHVNEGSTLYRETGVGQKVENNIPHGRMTKRQVDSATNVLPLTLRSDRIPGTDRAGALLKGR